MKYLIFSVLSACLMFNASADDIQIHNTTSNWLFVKVYFNDGTDCVPDHTETFCIPPSGMADVTVAGKIPVTARAFTSSSGCASFDYSTDSWAHNPWEGCTDSPTTNVNPYVLTWLSSSPGVWGITIS